jgi:hypothetical protein
VEDRARLLLAITFFAGCVPQAAHHSARCPEGTIATTDGCAPLPDWDPWAVDAGADSGVDDAAEKDASVAPDAGAELDAGAPDAAEVQFDLRGAWALRVVNAQMISSQLAEAEAVMFTSLSIVRIDRALDVSSAPCALESTPFGNTITTWPTETVRSAEMLAESASADQIDVGGNLSLARTQLLGWRTQDPDDELPGEAGDPRVYDGDGDQNPGVTLLVSGDVGGEMYVVSRSWLELSGTISSPDRIEGSSLTYQEQTVLDATNDLLVFNQTTAEPMPELSSFEMVRADDTIDCDTLLQSADVLFMNP